MFVIWLFENVNSLCSTKLKLTPDIRYNLLEHFCKPVWPRPHYIGSRARGRSALRCLRSWCHHLLDHPEKNCYSQTCLSLLTDTVQNGRFKKHQDKFKDLQIKPEVHFAFKQVFLFDHHNEKITIYLGLQWLLCT